MIFFYTVGVICAVVAVVVLPSLCFDDVKEARRQKNKYKVLEKSTLALLFLIPITASFFPQGRHISRILTGILLVAYWVTLQIWRRQEK